MVIDDILRKVRDHVGLAKTVEFQQRFDALYYSKHGMAVDQPPEKIFAYIDRHGDVHERYMTMRVYREVRGREC